MTAASGEAGNGTCGDGAREERVQTLSTADARRLLVRWHFRPTDLRGVFARHGSIQFDPLKPLGANADLVLQARVPGYRVDDWQEPVYGDRIAFDGWDKQASLVRMEDWPRRRIYHRWHREWWHERVFDRHPEVVDEVLTELREAGPLATADFEDSRRRDALEGSWFGASLTKHALRALWHTGRIATHHRRQGNHVYDLAERVIPAPLVAIPEPPDEEQLRFLVEIRHRAVGLLRPTAGRDLWSLDLGAVERQAIIDRLAAAGGLVPVDVDGVRFHAHPAAWELLDGVDEIPPRVRFIAPLDPLMWDRDAVRRLFGFEYVWEVYKPVKDRRWGYYVLPVLYGDRLVGRLDARESGGTLTLNRFWLEPWMEPGPAFWVALEEAFSRFLGYLGATAVRQNPSAHAVARPVRDALYAAARTAGSES